MFIVSMLAIAYLDYVTWVDIAIWSLYLIPVGLASWVKGFRAGNVLAILATLSMLAVGLVAGYSFSSITSFLFSLSNRLLALLAVSWFASRLCRQRTLESTLESYEDYLDYLHASLPDVSGQGLSSPAEHDRRQGADRQAVFPDTNQHNASHNPDTRRCPTAQVEGVSTLLERESSGV